jgi:hypothetical protein
MDTQWHDTLIAFQSAQAAVFLKLETDVPPGLLGIWHPL